MPTSLEPEISVLLHSYSAVFARPHSLLLIRLHDHVIPLFPNTDLVKVRPYRYPHSQKGEMKRIMQETLVDDIIQLSSSPFSFLVLLVKKKDSTWHFYMNYYALNPVTVKDSFLMLIVDELLDELFGAQYFSKLDLRFGYH